MLQIYKINWNAYYQLTSQPDIIETNYKTDCFFGAITMHMLDAKIVETLSFLIC